MNKSITFLTLTLLFVLVSGDQASDLKVIADCLKDYSANTYCNGDSTCNEAHVTAKTCSDGCNAKSTLALISQCINDCSSKSTVEKVKDHFSEYASCINGNILTYTSLLFSIFFMLF